MLLHKELINPQIRLSDMAEMKLGGTQQEEKSLCWRGTPQCCRFPMFQLQKSHEWKEEPPWDLLCCWVDPAHGAEESPKLLLS